MSSDGASPPDDVAARKPGAGDDLRTKLLEAALEAFASSGYEAMSVRELARDVGVSHNLVNHHFGSKRKFWQAAMENILLESTVHFVNAFSMPQPGTDPDVAMKEIMKQGILFFGKYPALAKIWAAESAQGGERLDFLIENFMLPSSRALIFFLGKSGLKDFRHLNQDMIATFVTANASLLFTHSALLQKLTSADLGDPDELDRYAESLAELIVHGLIGSPGGAVKA